MTRIGRKNDVSGNGVTLDYDMVLKVLRTASNDQREELRIAVFNLCWTEDPSQSAAEAMLRKAQHLAQITELLWVLQSMEPDQDGRWPESRWLGFELTRRPLEDDRSSQPKPKIGRPKGAKNKPKIGRPKGAKNKPKSRKKTRGPSRWNLFVKANPILFKSGPRKGRLNWKATAKAYREETGE